MPKLRSLRAVALAAAAITLTGGAAQAAGTTSIHYEYYGWYRAQAQCVAVGITGVLAHRWDTYYCSEREISPPGWSLSVGWY